MNQPRVHMCAPIPHPDPPPHPIPLGWLRAPALSALLHALSLHWSSILHMVYTRFNAILSNHPTLALSHIVQNSVLYISVSFAALHRSSLRSV